MKLMWHSDIKLTAKVYTDEAQLPIYDSIKNLPRLGGCTQLYAQISDREGQKRSQSVATSEGTKVEKTIDNGGPCPVLSLPVAVGELERAKGFAHQKTVIAQPVNQAANNCTVISYAVVASPCKTTQVGKCP